MGLNFTDNVTLIAAGVVTTTSEAYDVSKRRQITLEFISTGFTSGNIVYTVDGSNNGSDWVTGLNVYDATATNTAVGVLSKTASTTSNVGVYVPPGWRFIRAKATRTTDGTATVIMEAAG